MLLPPAATATKRDTKRKGCARQRATVNTCSEESRRESGIQRESGALYVFRPELAAEKSMPSALPRMATVREVAAKRRGLIFEIVQL